MSGFVAGGVFELTATKAESWHGRAGCCRNAWEMVDHHVRPAGFVAKPGRGGRFWRVTGPGLVDGSTDQLFAALRRLTPHDSHRTG